MHCYLHTLLVANIATWLMSATVDVLHFVQVSHDCFPLVVDVVKCRSFQRQLSPDVLAEKYVLYT